MTTWITVNSQSTQTSPKSEHWNIQGALWSFLVKKQKFTFTVTHQNSYPCDLRMCWMLFLPHKTFAKRIFLKVNPVLFTAMFTGSQSSSSLPLLVHFCVCVFTLKPPVHQWNSAIQLARQCITSPVCTCRRTCVLVRVHIANKTGTTHKILFHMFYKTSKTPQFNSVSHVLK